LRALFVCPGLGLGGAERQWASLLPALADSGFDVCVLALNDEGPFADDLRRAGIDVRCARMRSRFDLRGLRRSLAAYGCDFDVVVTRSVNAHVVGAVLARGSGAAHVATEHSQYDLLPLRAHQRLLVRHTARRIDAAICVTAAQIPALVRLGYPRSRITVIANAVRPQELAPTRTREETRRVLGVSADSFLALMLGGLRPEKQPLVFVEAVVRAHAREPRVRGVLVGDGTERASVDRACGASSGAVRAIGTRRDIGDVLLAADAVCLTSRSEALPLALLEALAVGRPIVASPIGGVPGIVLDGENGELVACGDVDAFSDALVRLARDQEPAARMAERARRLEGAEFAFSHMVAGYAGVLADAITRRTPVRGLTARIEREGGA
jgi:glycosyltransferase involved in cell wall biosynthesis